MKIRVYTVYDSKVQAYMRPFFQVSKGEALRSWIDAVNDGQTAMNKHPEDFTLFELGEWDDQSAVFQEHSTPLSLGVAIEVHRQYNQSPVLKEATMEARQ